MTTYTIENSKSYATEANLVKAVAKVFGTEAKYMVVRNMEGRYTAVFGLSWNEFRTAPIFHGFMVIA